MLKVESLSVNYGKKAVLADVGFTLQDGVTALLGLNGAGKTTLMKTLAGIVPYISGTIHLNPAKLIDANEVVNRFGFAPQFVPLVKSFTVFSFLEYLGMLDGLDRSESSTRTNEVIEICNLGEFRTVPLSDLSGGTAKRVSIAQSILVPSQVLLLDEPTSGLDPIQSEEIGKLIKLLSEKQSVLFSTHNLAEVQNWASNYLLLQNGRIRASGKGPDLDFELLSKLARPNLDA
jgi:ABC-2 type transport system ATP-binding protein